MISGATDHSTGFQVSNMQITWFLNENTYTYGAHNIALKHSILHWSIYYINYRIISVEVLKVVINFFAILIKSGKSFCLHFLLAEFFSGEHFHHNFYVSPGNIKGWQFIFLTCFVNSKQNVASFAQYCKCSGLKRRCCWSHERHAPGNTSSQL